MIQRTGGHRDAWADALRAHEHRRQRPAVSGLPTRNLANPNVSSPIFSSVLAIHFSAHAEKTTAGFTLTPADQQTLAAGQSVHLSKGGGDTVDIELVANFPDYISDPLPGFPAIVRGSNPFGLVVVADQIYVTDGGRNLVWQVDIPTGSFSPLATFPDNPEPSLPGGRRPSRRGCSDRYRIRRR